MSEMQEVYNRLGQLEVSMGEVKTMINGFVESMATRLWVQQEIAPIHEEMRELVHAVKDVSERQSTLFAAHEKYIVEESARRTELQNAQMQALKEQTVGAWFGKVVKVVAGLAAISIGAGIVVAILKVLIVYVLLGPK